MKVRIAPTTRRAAAACLALAVLALVAPAAGRAQALGSGAEWQGARWGSTLEQVLKAFPEAKKLDEPLQLADGNVVAAGIEKVVLGGTAFRVRFVFDSGGGLALVSLRTPEAVAAPKEQLGAIENALVAKLGPPAGRAEDRNFVEQRQVTWKTGSGRVDLKYIPGTIVVLHAAPSQLPPEAPPAPPAGSLAPASK